MPVVRRVPGRRPGLHRGERRQQQEGRLQRHQEPAGRGRRAARGAGKDERQGEHANPQAGLERSPPGVRRQVETTAVQYPVLGKEQVALRP